MESATMLFFKKREASHKAAFSERSRLNDRKAWRIFRAKERWRTLNELYLAWVGKTHLNSRVLAINSSGEDLLVIASPKGLGFLASADKVPRGLYEIF